MIILIFVIIFSGHHLNASLLSQKNEKPIIDVDYCELIHAPEKYDEKLIRVKAIYNYGLDGQVLYCSECGESAYTTWVKIEESYTNCTSAKIQRKFNKRTSQIGAAAVTVIGKFQQFHGDGRFNHGLRYQIILSCIEEATILPKNAQTSGQLPKKILQKAYCKTSKSKK